MIETLLTAHEAHRNNVAKTLGRKGLEQSIDAGNEPIELPQGYHYSDPKLLGHTKIHALLRSVEIGADVSDTFLAERSAMAAAEGLTPIDVAVESESGELVGFGSIFYRGSEGEFSDFVVHPEYQGQGIGKAIILERLRLAECAGVTTLRVACVEDTNTLHNSQERVSFYEELGFRPDEYQSGLIWRSELDAPLHPELDYVEFAQG